MKLQAQEGHPACLLDLWAVVGDDGEAYACAPSQEAAEMSADRLTEASEAGFELPRPLRVEATVAAGNPYHDERGRFTFSPGGRSTNPELAARQNLTSAGIASTLEKPEVPIKVTDVNEAVDLLAEGRKIELQQPDQVSTLLTEMRSRVQDAVSKGEQAPDYDLCNVSVSGTNLFCAEHKGFARAQMPQLSGVPVAGSWADRNLPKNEAGRVNLGPAFREHLVSKGIKVTDRTVPASHLRATQRELNGVSVARMTAARAEGTLPGRAIFTSNDNYVVDGHHRWAADVATDLGDNVLGDVDMPVAEIDMPILDVLVEAHHFTADRGLPSVSARENYIDVYGADVWQFDFAAGGNPYHDERGRFTHRPGGVATEEQPPTVEGATIDSNAEALDYTERWATESGFKDRLSKGQREAIGRYSDRYVDIQANLRTHGSLRNYDANIRDQIDSAFRNPGAQAFDELTVEREIYRGDTQRQLAMLAREQRIVGTRVTDGAFIPATVNPRWAPTAGASTLRLRIPKGNPVLPLTPDVTGHEGWAEVLLPRDSTYTIRSASRDEAGRWTYEAEVQAR